MEGLLCSKFHFAKVSLANYKMGGKTALLRYYGPGRSRLVR
jgi:hypothetical protein